MSPVRLKDGPYFSSFHHKFKFLGLKMIVHFRRENIINNFGI